MTIIVKITDSTKDIYPPLPMENVVNNTILNALAWTDGNVSKAAKLLGVNQRTVAARLKKMGLKGGR